MWGFHEMDHGAAIHASISRSIFKNSLLKTFFCFSQSKPRSNSQSSKLRISPSPGSKLQINQHSGDQLDSRSDIWSVEVSPTDTDSIDEDAEHEVARRNSNKQHKSSSKHSSKPHQNNNNHPQESQNKLHGPVIIGGGEPQYQNASRNEKLSDKKIKQMNQMNHKITQLSQTQSQSSSNNQNQSRNNTLTRHDSDTASPNGLEKNTESETKNYKKNKFIFILSLFSDFR